MQTYTENRLNFLPDRATRKYISAHVSSMIPMSVLKSVLIAVQGYIFMYLIDEFLKKDDLGLSLAMLSILIASAFLVNLFSVYRETCMSRLRTAFFRDLALKRAELSGSDGTLELSQKIYDWQQHNGGPVLNGAVLMEKHIASLIQTMIAIVIIAINVPLYLVWPIICMEVIAFFFSSVLKHADAKVREYTDNGMSRLLQNNRKGDYWFELISSEFSRMKSLRCSDANGFCERQYSSFMNPMMGVFRREAGGKLIVAIVEPLIAVAMTVIVVAVADIHEGLPFVIAILNMTLGVMTMFRYREDIRQNDSRMTSFMEFLSMRNERGEISVLPDDEYAFILDSVCYRYSGADEDAVNDVSFSFRKGLVYTIVGPNGSGKTTLIKVLLGLLEPCSGRFYSSCKEGAAYCPQNPVCFSFSVAENVSMSSFPEEKKVSCLLEKLGLDVSPLEKLGIDFRPAGIELSGGQQQRLVIARALYADSYVLIMDEPTSRLDVCAEKEIYDIVMSLKDKMTCIFVSHRLSSSFFSDEIIVMNGGKMEAHGTHADLMIESELYRSMYEKQAEHFNAINE